MFFNYLSYFTWVISLTLTTSLSFVKWVLHIRALFIFLAGHFQQWPILLLLAQDIVSLKVYDKIVRKQLTFDLYIQILRNCLTYFVNTMGTLFTSCLLLYMCFSFGLFLFYLPDMCACAIFCENQNKHKPPNSIDPRKVKNKKHHQIGGRKFYWVGSYTLTSYVAYRVGDQN